VSSKQRIRSLENRYRITNENQSSTSWPLQAPSTASHSTLVELGQRKQRFNFQVVSRPSTFALVACGTASNKATGPMACTTPITCSISARINWRLSGSTRCSKDRSQRSAAESFHRKNVAKCSIVCEPADCIEKINKATCCTQTRHCQTFCRRTTLTPNSWKIQSCCKN